MIPLKPWLWLPPRVAHDLSPFFLKAYSSVRNRTTYEWRPLEWRGLRFANRLGLAGGVDKDASSVEPWWTFGPGFLEIGTITPRPQGPNPGRIMARDLKRAALWNKMGFPSAGMEKVADNLEKIGRPYHTPLFLNIGKNRSTANEEAALDYIRCLEKLFTLGDAFVINISSPNTTGLRDLLRRENLRAFLKPIAETRDRLSHTTGLNSTHKPLLLKLSPDLENQDLDSALSVPFELGIDGLIVSNTTLARESGMTFPAEGGVSGRPLASRSLELLRQTITRLGPDRRDRLIISVGGVFSADDVQERLDLGADLVQVYSALIFQGPSFFKTVAQQMVANDKITVAPLHDATRRGLI